MTDKRPIILDLCAGTGAWSKPYSDAGYDVRIVTLPGGDVRTYTPPENVYGILAAPPCTMFAHSRQPKATREETKEALEVVAACMQIIWKCVPAFWALENPAYGTLRRWLDEPQLKFQPWQYGDPWTKYTGIWGHFNKPLKLFPVKKIGAWMHNRNNNAEMSNMMKGVKGRAVRRAVTSPGFARVFYEANK